MSLDSIITVALSALCPWLLLLLFAVSRDALRSHQKHFMELRLGALGHGLRPPMNCSNAAWLAMTRTLARLMEDPDRIELAFDIARRATGEELRPRVHEALERLLHDSRTRDTPAIVGQFLFLQHLPMPELLPLLVTCLLDEEPRIATAAAFAVGQAPATYAGATVALTTTLRQASSTTRHVYTWALQRLLETHPQLASAVADDPSPDIRQVQIRAASQLLTGELAADDLKMTLSSQVVAALHDEDAEVRRLAFKAFALAPHNAVLKYVDAGLADAVEPVRQAAVRALAAVGGEGGLTRLVKELPGATSEVREEILAACVHAAGKVPDGVRALAAEGPAWARSWAIRALALIGGSSLLDELAHWLYDDAPEVREAAARALAEHALRPATEAATLALLIAAWQAEEDPGVLLAIGSGLARNPQDEAREAVVGRLATVPDSISNQLIELLGRFEHHAPDSAIPWLDAATIGTPR